MGFFGEIHNHVPWGKKRPPVESIDRQQVFRILDDIKIAGYPYKLSDDRFVDRLSIADNVIRLSLVVDTKFDAIRETIRAEVIKALGAIEVIAGLHVQVRCLETQTTPLSQVKNIIAVASGKGGVGKSSCAVNIAYALKQTGAKVGLLDADVYGPSLVKMTGVAMPSEMRGARVIPPEKDGIKVISAAMFQKDESSAAIMRGPMATQVIQQFVSQVEWGALDVLVIDFPPGTGDVQITLAQQVQITAAVIITTPQEVSLIDARKAAAMFASVQIPIVGVVENMSYFQCGHDDRKHYIFGKGGGKKLAEELGVPLIAEVPLEEAVPLAADAGKSIVKILPESKAAEEFSQAAFSIAKASVNEKKFEPFSLTWERM